MKEFPSLILSQNDSANASKRLLILSTSESSEISHFNSARVFRLVVDEMGKGKERKKGISPFMFLWFLYFKNHYLMQFNFIFSS